MNKLYALLLLLAAAVSATLVVVPLRKLLPFEPQAADDVAVAYTLDRWSPLVSPALLIVGVVLAALLWKRSSWWLRAPAVVLVLALAVAAYLARSNIYERFFAPLDENRFTTVAEADLTDDEMVIGVVVDGEARAYPVAVVGYHHVVNDVVAGRPIVVTY